MDIAVREVESFPAEFSEGGITYKRTSGANTTYDAAFDRATNRVVLEHGQADVIILRVYSPPPVGSEFCVYLSRNEDNKLSGAESEHIRYEISPAARRSHVRCMYDAGQRGIKDMSAHAAPYWLPPANGALTAEDISPDHDVIGFDHPRKDIHTRKTKAGTTIRIGGNLPEDRELLSTFAVDVLDGNFTDDEVRSMNLYFEGSAPMHIDVAGTCSTHKGDGEPVSTVSVPWTDVGEGIVTHEVVHALRAMDGRKVQDRDSEEIETEYETTLRLQDPHGKGRGYYQFIPGNVHEHGVPNSSKITADVLADRVLATGATDKPLKGRRLTHEIVPNTIKRSRIETARPALNMDALYQEPRTERHSLRQMVAEDVDVYFQIKLPDKTTTEYHIRFDGARPPLTKIKKHLKAKFGKNIEAWEWQDGRRVRLISRPKKPRSRKRATKKRTSVKQRTPAKKRTTMKKRTPAKKPVAAKRYGLDAILGVPEGFL